MTTRRRVLIAFAAVPAALTAPRAHAAPTDAATQLVDRLLKDVIGIVNGGGAQKDKQATIDHIVDERVDVAGVAQFCLGRFWRTATPAQQQEYVTLFHRVLSKSISSHIMDVHDVSYVLGRTDTRDEGIAVGSTVTRPGIAPAKLDWIVDPASMKVIDLIAEGTSLRLTQRSDYSSFLSQNHNSIAALIDAMRRQSAAG
jgi:phospholipid transport system substrate-binding protein